MNKLSFAIVLALILSVNLFAQATPQQEDCPTCPKKSGSWNLTLFAGSDNIFQLSKNENPADATVNYNSGKVLLNILSPDESMGISVGTYVHNDYLKNNMKIAALPFLGVTYRFKRLFGISLGVGYRSNSKEIDSTLNPLIGVVGLYSEYYFVKNISAVYGRGEVAGNKRLMWTKFEVGLRFTFKDGFMLKGNFNFLKYDTETSKIGPGLILGHDFGPVRLEAGASALWNAQGSTEHPNKMFMNLKAGITYANF